LKSIFAGDPPICTSRRAASNPNIVTSTVHAPGVILSLSSVKAPVVSVAVVRTRSPCVARTVAPGIGWPSDFTVPDWPNATASEKPRDAMILNDCI
jgi:hypothetical protein